MVTQVGDINLNVSASSVAWYAAIVATFGVFKAINDLWNDRGRIRIQYQPGMLVKSTGGVYDESKKYFSTTVINKGRRPVKIMHVGAKFFGREETSLFTDSFFKGADRTLTELHPSTIYLTDQTGLSLNKLWYVYAIEAKGKEYRKYADDLPWHWRLYFKLKKYKNNAKVKKP
jgi:hypothetical protein